MVKLKTCAISIYVHWICNRASFHMKKKLLYLIVLNDNYEQI